MSDHPASEDSTINRAQGFQTLKSTAAGDGLYVGSPRPDGRHRYQRRAEADATQSRATFRPSAADDVHRGRRSPDLHGLRRSLGGAGHEPENGVELEALRRSVNRGQPYGEAKWQATMAKALSLESSLRDPWRPAGKKEGADAKKK